MGYPDWQTYNSLATLIAAALQSAGIPVLGNPIPLYSDVATSGSGTPALVGATVGGSAWDPNISHAQAMTEFDTYVDGNPCTVSSKSFVNNSPWPSSIPQSDQDLINAGAVIYASVKPDPAMTVADYGNMVNTLQMYLTAGAKLRPILWHEPQETFPSPSGWQAYWAYYQPGIKGLGLPCVYDSASHAGETGVASWWPAVTPDHALQDLYWNTWQNGTTLATLCSLGLQYGVPVGVGEWNCNSGSTKTPTTTQWNNYWNDMINKLTDVMVAGGDLSCVNFYMSSDAPKQPNNLLLSSSDWKVPGFNAVQAALSVPANYPGIVIPAGNAVTVTPLAPSPGGGYAIANGQSYDCVLILNTAAGSTSPWLSLELDWYNSDVRHAPAFHSQRWQIPAGNPGSAGCLISGHGPQRAAFLGVKLTNRDTVPITAQVQLNSTGRQSARDDLRFDAATSAPVPTYTLAGGQGDGLSLGEVDSVTINSGGTRTWLLGMFAGQVSVHVIVTNAAGIKTVHVSMAPQPPSRWGTANLLSQYLPLSAAPGDNDQNWTAPLPRAPCAITIVNNDANNVGVAFEVIALEQ